MSRAANDIPGDSVCEEDDGCPTESAVLKREWRKHTKRIKELETRDTSFQVGAALAKTDFNELKTAAQAVLDIYYSTSNQIDPLIDMLYDVLEKNHD